MSLPQEKTGSRMERKKEETRQRIVQTAMTLFEQNGVADTTMEQIAAAADIAKGTLYNYFPSKEFIIHTFMQRSFQTKYAERVQRMREISDTRGRMKMIFTELVRGVQAQDQIFDRYIIFRIQEMISLDQPEEIKSGLYRLGEEIIRLGLEDGELRADVDPRLLEELVEFAFMELVKAYYRDPASFHADEMIDKCVDVFMCGAGKG
ncbi:MAG: TetR/AcrR family transcriptional regulator [Anaerolineaceae bacterium]